LPNGRGIPEKGRKIDAAKKEDSCSKQKLSNNEQKNRFFLEGECFTKRVQINSN